jgi:hypothetical protein
MLNGEVANTKFIIFGFTWLELVPTTYYTQGKHANHYPTDAVFNKFGNDSLQEWNNCEDCFLNICILVYKFNLFYLYCLI